MRRERITDTRRFSSDSERRAIFPGVKGFRHFVPHLRDKKQSRRNIDSKIFETYVRVNPYYTTKADEGYRLRRAIVFPLSLLAKIRDTFRESLAPLVPRCKSIASDVWRHPDD